ncbi:MAG: 23S rRNA (uridine(2552)-2'-O)-methyltransferase RlmE [Pseudomonadota bacterium]
MPRTKSSRRWLKEHFDDAYVKKARSEGYRARSVYKLQEIDAHDRLLRPGMTVIDLGAAPGGWAQYAAQRVGEKGRIVALDILPMTPIKGVEFLQGDFTEQAVFDALLATLGGSQADLVLSDMAPNISGMRSVDQPRAMYLAELALDLARQVLKPGGDLLIKVFQGSGFDELYKTLRADFGQVVARKPKASRARTPEVYLLARNYRGH